MNLNQFSNGKVNEDYEEELGTKIDEETKSKAEEVVNKYKNYSESDLTKEIVESIKMQKQQGLYNKDAIINSINSLSGLISSEDQQKIVDLLNRIDNE